MKILIIGAFIYILLIGCNSRQNINKANEYFISANARLKKGKPTMEEYKTSIIEYSEAIELYPKFWHAYRNRGNSYRKIGEFEKSLDDLNNAIIFAGNEADNYIYFDRALANYELGNFDEACIDLNLASTSYGSLLGVEQFSYCKNN